MYHIHMIPSCVALLLIFINGKTTEGTTNGNNIHTEMISKMAQQINEMNDVMRLMREEMTTFKLRQTVKTEKLEKALHNLTDTQEQLRECRKKRESGSLSLGLDMYARENGFNAIPVSEVADSHHLTGLNNLVKLFVPKSCYEWRKFGFEVSGYYLIDPDGKGVGEQPVHVFCDMLTGYSFIGHDYEGLQEVEICEGPGCNPVDIQYNASMSQIEALMYNSQSCHQTIKVECYNSPFKTTETTFTWWEDRHGGRHEYWSGNQQGEHVCRCGLSHTCVIPDLPCNCDANYPDVWLHDEGTLSDITALPVTKLSFGMDSNDIIQSKMRFRLGPLRCYGSKTTLFHESCDELRWSGISRTGYYFLGHPDNLTLTHCAMKESLAEGEIEGRSSMPPHQAVLDGFQDYPDQMATLSARLEALESQVQQLKLQADATPQPETKAHQPVIFHSYASDHVTEKGTVKFNSVLIDTHSGYSRYTGKYTVPIKGVYLVSFYSERQESSKNNMVRLKKNDEEFAFARGDKETKFSTYGLNTVQKFEGGDAVYAHNQEGELYGCTYGCNGFSIILLQAE